MSHVRVAVLAAAFMLLALAADALWLFAVALPRTPPAPDVTPPPSGAVESQRERYDIAADRAGIDRAARWLAIGTAVTIPIVVASSIGLFVLFRHANSAER